MEIYAINFLKQIYAGKYCIVKESKKNDDSQVITAKQGQVASPKQRSA